MRLGVCVLALAVAVSQAPAQVRGAAGAPPAATAGWRLVGVRVFNDLQAGASVVRDQYDANGGFSELEISGRPNVCLGTERLRFTWRFTSPVAVLQDAQKFTATLSGQRTASTGACDGSVGARTLMSLDGSSGSTNPFNPQETSTIDGSRLWSSGTQRVAADARMGAAVTGLFTVEVDNRPHRAGSNRAWFNLFVATPFGNVRYVYLYEFGGAGPAPVPAPAPASGRGWHLTGVRVFNQLTAGSSLIRDSHDAAGGSSEVEVSGRPNVCLGTERLRFTWRFSNPVGLLQDAQKFSATLNGERLATTGACDGSVGARTELSFAGSSGSVNPFNPQETSTIDGGRMWTSGTLRVFADTRMGGQLSGQFPIEVDTRPHRPDAIHAWFEMNLSTPNGRIRYVYFYEWRDR